MTYKPSMAEAQAMGLCLLSRLPGLPHVTTLRGAVAQMHTLRCGWCDYDTAELQRILVTFNAARSRFDDERWQSLPPRAKGEAIRLAQGEAAA